MSECLLASYVFQKEQEKEREKNDCNLAGAGRVLACLLSGRMSVGTVCVILVYMDTKGERKKE